MAPAKKPLPTKPDAEVPSRERWLWENPSALAAVRKGLDESAKGKVQDLGDFSKFANDDGV